MGGFFNTAKGGIKMIDNKKLSPMPSSVEAENDVLGAILTNVKFYDDVKKYIKTPDVFYNSMNKEIWIAIEKQMSNNDVPTLLKTIDMLDEAKPQNQGAKYAITGYVTELITPAHTEQKAKMILDKYILRNCIKESRVLETTILKNGVNALDIIEKMGNSFNKISEDIPVQHAPLENIISDTVSSIYDTKNLVPSYLSMIDECIGGFTRKEVSIIAGRPGHGKTTTALNLVLNMVKSGYRVVVMNREMPNSEVMKKFICMHDTSISYRSLRFGVIDKAMKAKIKKALVELEDLFKDKLFMYDNIRDFATSAKELRRIKPDVVMDDYVQLIKPLNPSNDRRLQIEQVVNDYKWLAKSYNMVVLLVSQLNRDIEHRADPVPRMSDLSEGGSLEQTAEMILFCYYEYKVKYDNSSLGDLGYKIILGKNRYGINRSMNCGFFGDACTVTSTYEEALGLRKLRG